MHQNNHKIITILISFLLCLGACQSDATKEVQTISQEKLETTKETNSQTANAKELPIDMDKLAIPQETKMPIAEVREEVKDLLKEELKVDENNQHFKQIENLFKEITDKNKTRPEKRLLQNKLETYFSSPTEKVIEFTPNSGEKEQMSFHDFTRKVRMVSLNIIVENIALTESNLVSKIIIREK